MTQSAKPVLIAGGGIGGLAAALALAKHGIASDVLERDAVFTETGAGIQLGPNAVRVLESIGAAGRLAPLAASPGQLVVHDGNSGNVLSEMPLGGQILQCHGAPYWTAHRGDLHAALLAAAEAEPMITISLGFNIADITSTDEGVSATSTDGVNREGPLLAGADGLWSRVRQLTFGEAALQFSGSAAYRAVIPSEAMPREFQDNAVHIWLAPGAHVVHYPVRAGRDYAVIAVVEETGLKPGWDSAGEAEDAHRHTSHLSAAVLPLLGAVPSWRKWQLSESQPLPRWSKGRVTLLGDAAHPILPYLAQGGALALEDAVVLAAETARHAADPGKALRAYEERRRARAQRVQTAARRNGQIYHLEGLAARARDLVLRSTPPERLIANYDWLYGWRESGLT